MSTETDILRSVKWLQLSLHKLLQLVGLLEENDAIERKRCVERERENSRRVRNSNNQQLTDAVVGVKQSCT